MSRHKQQRPAETPAVLLEARELQADLAPLLVEIRDLLQEMREDQKWFREQLVRNGVVL